MNSGRRQGGMAMVCLGLALAFRNMGVIQLSRIVTDSRTDLEILNAWLMMHHEFHCHHACMHAYVRDTTKPYIDPQPQLRGVLSLSLRHPPKQTLPLRMQIGARCELSDRQLGVRLGHDT